MRKTFAIALLLLITAGYEALAGEISTLDQARAESARTGKLILLKFFKEG